MAPKISNFAIQSGLETICTFTNAIRNGTLVVKKHVVNDNGGTKTAADFMLHVKSGASDVWQPGRWDRSRNVLLAATWHVRGQRRRAALRLHQTRGSPATATRTAVSP